MPAHSPPPIAETASTRAITSGCGAGHVEGEPGADQGPEDELALLADVDDRGRLAIAAERDDQDGGVVEGEPDAAPLRLPSYMVVNTLATDASVATTTRTDASASARACRRGRARG